MKLVNAVKFAALLMPFVSIGHAADVDWEDWSFDYSTSSNSSGLVLTNVTYKGELVLGKASMPVMRVEYENDLCGPYADILASSRLEAAETGAPNDFCDNQAVCRRSFIQDGEKKFEIGSNWQIGEYQIYQTYYFSEKGTIDTRVYSRGLQCVIDHSHHAHWMFDFDIGGSANDRILRGDSDVQQVEFNDLRADVPHWRIEDPDFATSVRLVPSDDDGEPDSFSRWDAAGRKFNSSEVGRWRLGARGEIGSNFITPAERIDGEDLVFWYVSHLPHRAAEGSSIWHSSGPRIEVIAGDESATQDPAPEPTPEQLPEQIPEPRGDNLLVNGGFDDTQSLAGWANCGDAAKTQTVSADGRGNALRIFNGGCMYQEVLVTPGLTYSLSCDAQRTGSEWTILEFSFLDANFNVSGSKDMKQVHSSGDFRAYRFSGKAPANAVYALTLAYSDDDTLLDACQLVQGESTPVDLPLLSDSRINLLGNGGFEDGFNNWNSCAEEDLLATSFEADTDTGALAISGGGCIYQEFPVTPGFAYGLTCRAQRTDASLYTSVTVSMLDSNYAALDTQELPVISTGFEDYTATVTATSDSTSGTVVLYSESPAVFDNCEVLAIE